MRRRLELTLVRSESLDVTQRIMTPRGRIIRASPLSAGVMGRRAFAGLSTSAIGSLLVPAALTTAAAASSGGCDQAVELAEQLAAEILKYLVDKLVWALEEAIGGDVQLENHESSDQTGNIDMELLNGEKVEDGASGDFTVPAGMVNTYKWKGLSTPNPGDYLARAISKLNEQKTDMFSVK